MNAATKLPTDVGPIHFVGIGGIGMSGIAEVLLNHGYRVQGSDLKSTKITDRLVDLGATVFEGQEAANIEGAAVVVISSAIKPGNPELDAARVAGLPIVRRAEMLAELMRLKSNIAVAGTHGKTTTTTMVAELLVNGGIDPTVVNGGIIHAYGSNARMGQGEWMVVEADESDGTFLKLPATIAVVTNMDPEHLDYYGSYDELRDAFDAFVANIPFYGFAALCIDHPEVQAMIPRVSDRRIVTYGLSPQADIRAVNLVHSAEEVVFDVEITDRKSKVQATLKGLGMPMLGEHNVQNALAAIAIAAEMEIGESVIRRALASFEGVKRRFTRVGDVGGITIIDDYGHHPVEIAAVLKTARAVVKGKVIAVVQPHRYTRLRDLFEEFCRCFNDADAVIVADVFEAGEEPIEGIHRESLVEGLGHHGHRTVMPLAEPSDLAGIIDGLAGPGDMVVCLGAGDITRWANALPDELRQYRSKGKEAANDAG